MPKPHDPRNEIRDLIGKHADELSKDQTLRALFERTIEDLVTAGIDRSRVVNAIVMVGFAHLARDRGANDAISKFRTLATWLERETVDDGGEIEHVH